MNRFSVIKIFGQPYIPPTWSEIGMFALGVVVLFAAWGLSS